MINPSQSMPTPIGEFQAHFGGPPGVSDAAAECKKWEKLCGELLADRQTLSDQLAKAQKECELYRTSHFHMHCKDYTPPNLTKEELEEALARLDDKPSIRDLIAEFENAPEN